MALRQLAVMLAMLTWGSGSALADGIELIADRAFDGGVWATDGNGDEKALRWNGGTNAPVWRVAQHFSKSRLGDEARLTISAGRLIFDDGYALVEIHGGREGADLVAGLNAFHEYGGSYRKKGDAWPHLYFSQAVASPGGHLEGRCPSIADMSRLDFSISVRLLHDRKHIGPGYCDAMHAAQFVFFLTIQNLTHGTPGFGDYYNFGVLLYDDREPMTTLHAMHDAGSPRKPATEKLIYDVGAKPFTDELVGAGRWVDIRGDLLPHIKAGLSEAWKRGYLPASTNLCDYRVGSVIMGWEIPGLNDAAMAIKCLRATAVVRGDP